MTVKISDLRLVKVRNARIDGGSYKKPEWACKFRLAGIARSVPVYCGGDHRPLGSNLIAAMREHIKNGRVSERELFDIKIVE